jgi:hypothetical protein
MLYKNHSPGCSGCSTDGKNLNSEEEKHFYYISDVANPGDIKSTPATISYLKIPKGFHKMFSEANIYPIR